MSFDLEKYVKNYCDKKFIKKKFIKNITPIPVTEKIIGYAEIKNIIDAALDGWLTTGKFNKEFEKKLAEFIGIKSLLTVNSGSSANLVAFSSLTSEKLKDKRIYPGDEVIAVAAGFPTTVNPIFQNNAVPVFVDINLKTYNIDVDLIEEAITPKTKAIMLAHTLGNPFNLRAIMEICKKYNLWLIEDTCDALGSKYEGRHVGTFGDIATLSFYPAHHITMGEGGAVYTNSIKLKRIAESIRDWGRDCYCETGKDNTCNKRFDWKFEKLPMGYDHKYTYTHAGYNLKITDLQAACGLGQLERLPHFIEMRKKNFNYLKNKMLDFQDKIILPEPEINSEPSWFGFAITLRKNCSISRQDLLKKLTKKLIGTRLLFAGNITKQPYFKNLKYRISGDLKNTDTVMENTFWLGVHPSLSEKMLDYMVESIKKEI